MTDICNLLSTLPEVEESDKRASWFGSPDYYPIFQRVASIVKPRRILESGTRLGYSLISLIDGSGDTEYVAWIDNQSALPDSNARAERNLLHYYDISGIEPVTFEYFLNADDVEQVANRCFDLIHFDSDHSYEGTLHELQRLHRLFPQSIVLVDDFSASEFVKRAVLDFTAMSQLPFMYLKTHQGLAVIDPSTAGTLFQKLRL